MIILDVLIIFRRKYNVYPLQVNQRSLTTAISFQIMLLKLEIVLLNMDFFFLNEEEDLSLKSKLE